MIVMDTHIWVWWIHGDKRLNHEYSKLVEYKRLELPCSINDWIRQALAYPNIKLLSLSPEIAIESTQLPQPFHRDPADQIIVATARIHNSPLVTVDEKIRNYSYVDLLP